MICGGRKRFERMGVSGRAIGVAVWMVAGSVAGFHAWLLWEHAASGRLFEPAVTVRWLLGVALVGAMVALRAAGPPPRFGRRAAVLWILVSVLHWNALSTGVESMGDATLALPVEVVATTAAGVLGVVCSFFLLRLLASVKRAWPLSVRRWVAHAAPMTRTPALSHAFVVGCRPPPLFALHLSVK